MAKVGRKAGIPNRRSQMLLVQLRKDHNFEIVDEILELYGYSKAIYLPLFAKVRQNLDQELSPTSGMDATEVTAMNEAGKSMGDTLGKLMAYCYPKLKAIEIGQSAGEKIHFNISIPNIDAPKKLPIKNVTPKR